MKKRNKESKTDIDILPKEGGCTSLFRDKSSLHPPFLGELPANTTENEDKLLRYLARLLIDIYLDSESLYGKEEGSYLLPGIDKRTG